MEHQNTETSGQRQALAGSDQPAPRYMALTGDLPHDKRIVLGHMLYPNDPDRVAGMAALWQVGQRERDQGDPSGMAEQILRLTTLDIDANRADGQLKSKPWTWVGGTAGSVLLKMLSLKQHQPDKVSLNRAYYLLEQMVERGEFMRDAGAPPRNRISFRHAFTTHRSVVHLYAAQNLIGDEYAAQNCFEVASLASGNFARFLGYAEALARFGEGQPIEDKKFKSDKRLLDQCELWRAPPGYEVESKSLPRLDPPNEDDLKSYRAPRAS